MKLTLALLTAAAAMASPIMYPDGISVDRNDPRIGRHVHAVPNSIWRVWGNDNTPGSPDDDYDLNDAVMRITFGHDGAGHATWLGSNSAWRNHYIVEGLIVSPTASASWVQSHRGERTDIRLVTQYGGTYATGTRNILTDLVKRDDDDQVPEPATWATFGATLMALALVRRST